MTLVNGVWHDNEIKNEKTYGQHKFTMMPNSEGINIVKCEKCKVSRMYLKLMEIEKCEIGGIDNE